MSLADTGADDDFRNRQLLSRPMSAFGGSTDILFQGRQDRF